MELTKVSPVTGIAATLVLNITEGDYFVGLRHWNEGMNIQDAFRTLNADEREFILTGMTSSDWNNAFPPEKELSEDEETELFANYQ